MDELLRSALSDVVEQATGEAFSATSHSPCHGGCIHQSGICSDGERSFFIKVNRVHDAEMFEAEANGLMSLNDAGALRIPQVMGRGVAGDQAFLVLEAVDLSGRPSSDSWCRLGEGLAALHRVVGPNHGWNGDNFIGRTPQINGRHGSWADFFVEERLRPQFEMARCKGFSFPDVEGFLKRASERLADHQPKASLLHGDLWSGNVGFSISGDPVIFDPAVYHGDRETDLAFTEFFGGFAPEFYKAYQASYPMESGFEQRRELYNLYHVLNHANLFGGGYVGQAQAMMQTLIA